MATRRNVKTTLRAASTADTKTKHELIADELEWRARRLAVAVFVAEHAIVGVEGDDSDFGELVEKLPADEMARGVRELVEDVVKSEALEVVALCAEYVATSADRKGA
jgi:hypothetical protein